MSHSNQLMSNIRTAVIQSVLEDKKPDLEPLTNPDQLTERDLSMVAEWLEDKGRELFTTANQLRLNKFGTDIIQAPPPTVEDQLSAKLMTGHN